MSVDEEKRSNADEETTVQAHQVEPSGESSDEQQQSESQSDQLNRELLERIFKDQQEVMKYFNLSNEIIEKPRIREYVRTYSLRKKEEFFGYGLAFHTEKIIPSLPEHKLVFPVVEAEPDSPAAEAGIEYGQRMIAVNNQFMNADLESLEDAVAVIDDSYYSRETTDITVIEPEFWQECMKNPNLAAAIAEATTRF